MYLGKVNKTREVAVMAQEQFTLKGKLTTIGPLLDGRHCKMLLKSKATKSFRSKNYYLKNKSLHDFPKFSSKAKINQVGNSPRINTVCHSHNSYNSRPYVWNLHYKFWNTHDNLHLDLGVKTSLNWKQIWVWDLAFKLLNRSIPVFPVQRKWLNQRRGDLWKQKHFVRWPFRIRHNYVGRLQYIHDYESEIFKGTKYS